MKRLFDIAIKSAMVLLIILALLLTFLRLSLPHLEKLQPVIIEQIQASSGMPIEIANIKGEWKRFGPSITLDKLSLITPEIVWQADSVSLELDIWRSLLYLRWQFRDLTFYNMNLNLSVDLHQLLMNSEDRQGSVLVKKILDIFLRQLNYFDLRDSYISFYSPSGQKLAFDVPQLTWLNSRKRHQAEGEVRVIGFDSQYGALQVRLDLRDNSEHLLDHGTVYLQADNVDMSPWLSRWLRKNTGLQAADFSLAAWMDLKQGEILGASVLLKHGNMAWQYEQESHALTVEQQMVRLDRVDNGWLLDVPMLSVSLDQQAWPKGTLSALWLDEGTSEELLRLRAADLQLEQLNPLLPIFTFLEPEKLSPFLTLNPEGRLQEVGIDIPIHQVEKSQFVVKWDDLSWNHWGKLPGVNHFSGEAWGTIASGQLKVALQDSLLPYGKTFRAPLEVREASGSLNWQSGDEGWRLWSEQIDIQAKALWVNGGFEFSHSAEGEDWLNIIAGIRLYDAREAWRYFPEPLMKTNLVDYLTEALQGGKAENATLLFTGVPQRFPYRDRSGLFEVYVPLREATFLFRKEWQPLTELSINLDFINNGLWMDAKTAKLDKVSASNIKAVIPEYDKKRIVVDAAIVGKGEEIRDYLSRSPLKMSVGKALEQVQIFGNVNGHLHLDIPMDGQRAPIVTGWVKLLNNRIWLSVLDNTLEQVKGTFTFNGGNLQGKQLTGSWFNQPIQFNFTSQQKREHTDVQIGINGIWQLQLLPGLTAEQQSLIAGKADWRSHVNIRLPTRQPANYQVTLESQLSEVSNHLSSLFKLESTGKLPVYLRAEGDQAGFVVTGKLAEQYDFATQWSLHKTFLSLDKGVFSSSRGTVLPKEQVLLADLPPIKDEKWLSAFISTDLSASDIPKQTGKRLKLPPQLEVTVPTLNWLGQYWNQLRVQWTDKAGTCQLGLQANEINVQIDMCQDSPWRVDVDYLYYNPQWTDEQKGSLTSASHSVAKLKSFNHLPPVMLRCSECWLMGQNLRKIELDLVPRHETLKLSHGLFDIENTTLTLQGEWSKRQGSDKVKLSGQLDSHKIDQSLRYFGIATPLQEAPVNIDFNLSWAGIPWQPIVNTVEGKIVSKLGKGEIANRGGGTAGQILRLVSFNALIRKLNFDFSDTFGESFYFDSINGSGVLKNGVMTTDDTLVKGLTADIALTGQINFVTRQLAMEAVVAPELSATVGVATAFAVNPVVGVAVFAASQVLSPLWNKISFIRYKISGDMDNPEVSEILRQSKKEK